MGFFSNFFHSEKRSRSAVLIAVGIDSLSGAYIIVTKGKTPKILYSSQSPFTIYNGEPYAHALIRELDPFCTELLRGGAPALLRAFGSGRSDDLIVSIDIPESETAIRTEIFERRDQFIFTEAMASTALEKTRKNPSSKALIDESIVNAALNGYETPIPFGKNARKASITVFSSYLDEAISKTITSTLRKVFHVEHVSLICGTSLRLQALRIAFPHENDTLIIDAMGYATTVAFVQKNAFVALARTAWHRENLNEWIRGISFAFTTLTQGHSLPRVIFLLAGDSDRSRLQQALLAARTGSFWPSGNQTRIITILPSHVSGMIHQTSTIPASLESSLLALYYQNIFVKSGE